jgi:anaerobic dimethyl sulfoxide reductase subunit C (anchor subunit)
MQDWALVIFTLCISAATGACIFYAVERQKAPDHKLERGLFYLLIMVVIGLLGSLLHLGRPFAAPYSILNIGSSWLSREILFAGGFFALMVISWFLERRGKASAGMIWVTGLVGILAVFSMTQIYMSSLIPAWQSWYTLVEFFVATAILGSVVAMLTLGDDSDKQQFKWIMLGAILLQLALLPNYLGGLGAGVAAGQQSVSLLSGTYGILSLFRWLLILVGMSWFLLVPPKKDQPYPALALIAGVVLGRYLFYVTGVVISIGMSGM